MRIKIDRFLASEAFISLFYRLILFYSWTFRLKIENDKDWMDYRKKVAVLFCFALGTSNFFLLFGHLKIINPSPQVS